MGIISSSTLPTGNENLLARMANQTGVDFGFLAGCLRKPLRNRIVSEDYMGTGATAFTSFSKMPGFLDLSHAKLVGRFVGDKFEYASVNKDGASTSAVEYRLGLYPTLILEIDGNYINIIAI